MLYTNLLRLEALEARDVPTTFFALDHANNLLRFDSETPQVVQATTPVIGLNGETLVGMDFRADDGKLYGVTADTATNSLRMYFINPFTGAATPVALAQTLPSGHTLTGATKFGVDIYSDLFSQFVLQVFTDLDNIGTNANNIRMNPNNGTLIAVDADLDYSGLPAGSAPEVTVSYTRVTLAPGYSFVTNPYGIVSGTDRLVRNGIYPFAQSIGDVGPLGVDTSANAALDIIGTDQNPIAFAALEVGGTTGLYSINLVNGAATLINTIGTGATPVIDITGALPQPPVMVGGSLNGQVLPLDVTTGQAVAGTAATPFSGLNVNVRSTKADVNGDGIDDLIAVTGPGTPVRMTVISGWDNSVLVPPTAPFKGSEEFTGGAFVSAGDLDQDGKHAEWVVTPDQGGGPRVVVFSWGDPYRTLRDFLGIDDVNFRGGARTALGDFSHFGHLEIAVAAGYLGGPRVAVHTRSGVLSFYAFPGADATTLRNGVYIAAGDMNGDGYDDLIFGAGPGGAPRVFVMSGQILMGQNNLKAAYDAPPANFYVAGNSTSRGGVRVAVTDADLDGMDDLVIGSGEGVAAGVRLYLARDFVGTSEPSTVQDIPVFSGATLTDGVFVG